MRNAVIFDMDGTLADVRGIRHFLHPATNGKGYKDFHAFHRESVNVPPHPEVVNQAQVNHLMGNANIIVTARSQMWARHTAMWLALNGVPSDAMFMRADGDSRPDTEVKKDILDTIRCSWNVIHAVDDNPAVIALWQSEGIPVTIIEGWEH
jgi:phosphoglycolate phosphatase-like HAD superfamily hydrolase